MPFTTFLVIFCSLFEAVAIFHLLRSFLVFCCVFVCVHFPSFVVVFSHSIKETSSPMLRLNWSSTMLRKNKVPCNQFSCSKSDIVGHTNAHQDRSAMLLLAKYFTYEDMRDWFKCQVQPHHLKWTQNNQVPFISRLLWARRDIGSAFLHFAAFLRKCDVGYASEHSRGRKVCRSKEWKVSHNPPSCYSARDRKSI